jgi:hypothetical protein
MGEEERKIKPWGEKRGYERTKAQMGMRREAEGA